MTAVEVNGVMLGVEHFGDAAAPLVLLAGGDHALLARLALRGPRPQRMSAMMRRSVGSG